MRVLCNIWVILEHPFLEYLLIELNIQSLLMINGIMGKEKVRREVRLKILKYVYRRV